MHTTNGLYYECSTAHCNERGSLRIAF